MPKPFKFYFILATIVSLAFFWSSCQKNVTLTRLMPAEINVPNHVQRLLIVDRTAPQSGAFSVIEGILTGEMPFEVKNAIESTMATVQQELNTSPRYEVIRASERLRGGFFSQTFPIPLDWSEIEVLCNKYGTHAVLTMEMFSSDFVVTEKKVVIKKTVGSGNDAKQVEVPGILTEGIATVRVGFRIYDPAKRNIVDQKEFSRTNTWTAEAENKTAALAMLVDKVKATAYVGNLAGAFYARRVAPMYLEINRSFYQKSKTNPGLEAGSRLAEVDRWEDAIATWRGSFEHADSKTAGKLAYNIAIGYEVLGDLQNAKEWAGLAYADFGLKNGRNYAREITQRMLEEEMLRDQLAKDYGQ